MPTRKPNPAHCLYCHQEYNAMRHKNGPCWCRCREAQEARVIFKAMKNREYFKACYDGKRKPRVKTTGKRVRPNQFKGVYIKPRMNLCKHCHQPTANRFYCSTCLEMIARGCDLDFVMASDEGYSKRLGVRG